MARKGEPVDMTPLEGTAARLLDNYLYQKSLLHKRANVRHMPAANRQKLEMILGPHMRKAAALCDLWNGDPGIIMEAAFAFAKKAKLNDGPFPNMLGSSQYIRKALGYHLQLPSLAVAEQCSRAYMLEQVMAEHAEYVRFLWDFEKKAGPMADLMAVTSIPVTNRFLHRPWDLSFMKQAGADVLEELRTNRRRHLLAEEKGWPYKRVAAHYHKLTTKS